MGKKMKWWATLSPKTRQIFLFWFVFCFFGFLTTVTVTAMFTGHLEMLIKALAPYFAFLL